MRRSLADWLEYQQRQHPREIALGLERVRPVAARLGLTRPAPVVVTVAGTNGKGSTVAFLEAICAAAGYRTGAYTSPHLRRYNERVRILGEDADDDVLCGAFERIDQARDGTQLTYFEYGTLAALDLFERAALDVALLEVGLGGRLDAVNLVDADAAIVTTVDLDHQDWLGADRGAIAREKAGVFRAGRPAVVGEREPPPELLEQAHAIGASLIRLGVEYDVDDAADDVVHWADRSSWRFRHRDGTTLVLPDPTLRAPAQRENAAAAIAALHALGARLPIGRDAYATGIASAALPARLQRLGGDVDVLIDVAHNPQAARQVAEWLARNPVSGRTLAVFAALGDKDIAGIAGALEPQVTRWFLAGLADESNRGLDAHALAQRIGAAARTTATDVHATVRDACRAARAEARPGDRILAFGSFFTAAAALACYERPAEADAPL